MDPKSLKFLSPKKVQVYIVSPYSPQKLHAVIRVFEQKMKVESIKHGL